VTIETLAAVVRANVSNMRFFLKNQHCPINLIDVIETLEWAMQEAQNARPFRAAMINMIRSAVADCSDYARNTRAWGLLDLADLCEKSRDSLYTAVEGYADASY